LDIAGAQSSTTGVDVLHVLRRLAASLTLKMIGLVVVFVALPVMLYWQFESADDQRRDLVVRGIQQRSWLIAQALTPILDRPDGPPHKSLNQELRRFKDNKTLLKLMLRPAGMSTGSSFYYIASVPEAKPEMVGVELEGLSRHGILQQLSESCAWDSPIDIRYRQPDGHEEIMTSVVPIQSRWGCWVLLSAHPTSEFLNISIGRSYWQTREIQVAAVIYFVFALLAVLVTVSVWRSLHHFRQVAREIREGRRSDRTFTARNVVPELTSVAADFDHFVHDLRRIAQDMRQASEDNAHSLKGPICTIQSSLEPIKRVVLPDNQRAARAISLIESSLRRLHSMVNATQRIDYNTANLIDAPRLRMNLSDIVADILLRYREVLAEHNVRLIRALEEGACVLAGRGVLDTIFENILDNAISFAPERSTVSVYVFTQDDHVMLHVDDEGPGIDPGQIEMIFDRYFSSRAGAPSQTGRRSTPGGSPGSHAGLGLWIVHRNVEAVGGTISAYNRLSGGLSIRIAFPAAS
jgi:two-component system sensor histidine kinase ChvG